MKTLLVLDLSTYAFAAEALLVYTNTSPVTTHPPQQNAAPACVKPHVCRWPASSCAKLWPPETSTGVLVLVVPPLPNWKYWFHPAGGKGCRKPGLVAITACGGWERAHAAHQPRCARKYTSTPRSLYLTPATRGSSGEQPAGVALAGCDGLERVAAEHSHRGEDAGSRCHSQLTICIVSCTPDSSRARQDTEWADVRMWIIAGSKWT